MWCCMVLMRNYCGLNLRPTPVSVPNYNHLPYGSVACHGLLEKKNYCMDIMFLIVLCISLSTVLYLMSWSLGATMSGLGVLVLALSLVYTGSICKPKTPLPKSLVSIFYIHVQHLPYSVFSIISNLLFSFLFTSLVFLTLHFLT